MNDAFEKAYEKYKESMDMVNKVLREVRPFLDFDEKAYFAGMEKHAFGEFQEAYQNGTGREAAPELIKQAEDRYADEITERDLEFLGLVVEPI